MGTTPHLSLARARLWPTSRLRFMTEHQVNNGLVQSRYASSAAMLNAALQQVNPKHFQAYGERGWTALKGQQP